MLKLFPNVLLFGGFCVGHFPLDDCALSSFMLQDFCCVWSHLSPSSVLLSRCPQTPGHQCPWVGRRSRFSSVLISTSWPAGNLSRARRAPCSAGSLRISRSQGSVLSPYWPLVRFLQSLQRRWQEALRAAGPLCPSARTFLRRIHKGISPKERQAATESTSTLWQKVFESSSFRRWVLSL